MSSFECNDANGHPDMMSKMAELMIGSAPTVAAHVDASAVPSELSVASVAVTEEASSLTCTDDVIDEIDFLLAACGFSVPPAGYGDD